MNRPIFIGVDAQVDFIDGALPNERAAGNVAALNQAAVDARAKGARVIWTQDTHAHAEYYLNTLEGRRLPVPHCEVETDGWRLHPAIEVAPGDICILKPTFGIKDFGVKINECGMYPTVIIMGGYCTDICGISNALILRAHYPDVPIYWLDFASAATTPEKQEAALAVMESCQIDVLRSYDKYQMLLDGIGNLE